MQDKQQIRTYYRTLRDTITPVQAESMGTQIANNLLSLPLVQQAGVVMGYSSFNSEVPTQKLLERLLAKRYTVVLPTTNLELQTMDAVRIDGLDELKPGNYGIAEPVSEPDNTLKPSLIDIVLLPGLAFDRKGHRIGYGKGYYDRFLPRCPNAVRIGLAYDIQVTQALPFEPHDLPVHLIVTQKEVIRCA